ncbi:MAG: glycosyltransferase family 4 protein [Spirochaetaceae bacterium]|nr:MAG: glycosyltransferase family 4 protein [Spirochaetaceae bacterium]
MKPSGRIILLSGLPPDRKPSFFRQLHSLAAVWAKKEQPVLLGGPHSLDAEIPSDATAVIALGFPDQFPFLHGKVLDGQSGRPILGLPCFLWSQFSRIPRSALPRLPTYIPLTAKTEAILRGAGVLRIGPVIPHGVDTELFAPFPEPERRDLRRRHHSTDVIVIGTVGNNSRRKRFDLIIRSFALFAVKQASSRLIIKTNRLVSLDGVDLPALVARENLQDRVEFFVKEMSETQMVALYNRMDLYLNLSEWEGFCIPVIEAMACGIPVVSLAIQGPGEILPYEDTLVPDSLIREEEGAVLFTADPRAASRVLLTLAGRGELWRRLRREGRAAAIARYDIRRVAEQWEALLFRGYRE